MIGTPERVSATDTPVAPWLIQGEATVIQVMLVSTAVDTANTGQTHILRSGLCLGQMTAGASIRKYVDYLDGEADGRGTGKAILVHSVNMKDSQGTARDTIALVAIGGDCLVEVDNLYAYDANFGTDLEASFKFSTSYEPA